MVVGEGEDRGSMPAVSSRLCSRLLRRGRLGFRQGDGEEEIC